MTNRPMTNRPMTNRPMTNRPDIFSLTGWGWNRLLRVTLLCLREDRLQSESSGKCRRRIAPYFLKRSFSCTGLPFQLEIGIGLGEGPVLLPILNNWIVLMHRIDGSLDFYRNWTEYRNGFGEIGRGEFWLGNEKVHRLTNRTGLAYSLRVEVHV